MGIISYALYGFNAMYPGCGRFGGRICIRFMVDVEASVDYMTELMLTTHGTQILFPKLWLRYSCNHRFGAVAERIKLSSFMVFATLLVTFADRNVILAMGWRWLSANGFTILPVPRLHGFGGFAALACAIILKHVLVST